jgi:hypothetical protein
MIECQIAVGAVRREQRRAISSTTCASYAVVSQEPVLKRYRRAALRTTHGVSGGGEGLRIHVRLREEEAIASFSLNPSLLSSALNRERRGSANKAG